MSDLTPELDTLLKAAVQHFWKQRAAQEKRQGKGKKKAKDRGGRSAVTGGKHLDGLILLLRRVLTLAGIPSASIYCRPTETGASGARKRKRRKPGDPAAPTHITIPGWYRPEKDWDLLVVYNRLLIAVVETKSHVDSFGNNVNNRAEEAVGNATDFWAAYREGAFRPSSKPWLGYFMLLEDCDASTRPIRNRQPHFPVFPEFANASYAKRYEILTRKLVRDRLYDSACLIMSPREGGLAKGEYREPDPEIGVKNFVASLLGCAMAVVRVHGELERPGAPPEQTIGQTAAEAAETGAPEPQEPRPKPEKRRRE